MSAYDLVLYILSFVAIWLGAGLIIRAVDGVSKKLGLSSFSISFFLLGMLTSIPEFAVGLTAVASRDPEIFVGNLLGGIPVLFLVVIPLLAIAGGGVAFAREIRRDTLFVTLAIIAMPFVFILDKRISPLEAVALIVLYVLLFIFIEKKRGVLDTAKKYRLVATRSYSLADMLLLLLGVGVVFISSRFIVDKTIYFSRLLSVSPFVISLLGLALGTNLPEFSVAVRSLTLRRKDIALGDYLGSAAANVLFLGVLTLISHGEVVTASSFAIITLFVVMSIGLFYYFSQTHKDISRTEGLFLLALYIVFVAVELLKQ